MLSTALICPVNPTVYSPVGCLFAGHSASIAVPNVMVSQRAHSLAVGSPRACSWRGCLLQLPPRRSRWQSQKTLRVSGALRTGIPYTESQSVGFDRHYASGSQRMSTSRKTFFYGLSLRFDSVTPTHTSETSSRAQGGGSVTASSSSSAASVRVAIAVAIALKSVNISEAWRFQLL